MNVFVFFFRVRAAGYHLIRPRANIGRYMMLKKHHSRAKAGPNRCSIVWYMAWYGMVWYGMAWHMV